MWCRVGFNTLGDLARKHTAFWEFCRGPASRVGSKEPRVNESGLKQECFSYVPCKWHRVGFRFRGQFENFLLTDELNPLTFISMTNLFSLNSVLFYHACIMLHLLCFFSLFGMSSSLLLNICFGFRKICIFVLVGVLYFYHLWCR